MPALGFHALTPLYQRVVDVLCRDDVVKRAVVALVERQRTSVGDAAAAPPAARRLRVLDVACGPAKLVRLLAERLPPCCHVTGLDIDEAMVRTARLTLAGVSNTDVVHGDARRLPFADGAFDVVVESLMLHHLGDDDKRAVLREVHRVLVPRGKFVFVDWLAPRTALARLGFGAVRALDGAANVAAHADGSVLRLVADTGFDGGGVGNDGGGGDRDDGGDYGDDIEGGGGVGGGEGGGGVGDGGEHIVLLLPPPLTLYDTAVGTVGVALFARRHLPSPT